MNILAIFVEALTLTANSSGGNLTFYQCIKNSWEECGPEKLLPCPRVADRCVTHVTKHAERGYLVKRECGLGPCRFEDDMAVRGLGMNGCDGSGDEYFCVFCCETDGCNLNSSVKNTRANKNAIVMALVICLRGAI